LALAPCASCGPGEELPPSLIEQADQQEQAATQPLSPGQGPASTSGDPAAPRAARYVKPGGLHVDIPYLSGRRLADVPEDALLEQFGVEISRDLLPESEEHVVFEKLEIWLYDGRIYRIKKALAHPMDIPTALGTSGFPLDLGQPLEAANELRWMGEYSQKRIRLLKNKQDERLYDFIEVWKFFPKELD
jgi:hypothetical protein